MGSINIIGVLFNLPNWNFLAISIVPYSKTGWIDYRIKIINRIRCGRQAEEWNLRIVWDQVKFYTDQLQCRLARVNSELGWLQFCILQHCTLHPQVRAAASWEPASAPQNAIENHQQNGGDLNILWVTEFNAALPSKCCRLGCLWSWLEIQWQYSETSNGCCGVFLDEWTEKYDCSGGVLSVEITRPPRQARTVTPTTQNFSI